MSAAQELSDQLNALADSTDQQAASLQTLNQELSDQAQNINAQLDSTQTGRDVAQSFQTAIDAVNDATGQLHTAVQNARDYAQKLLEM